MDNIYRRDHEMAYISDDAVVAQQKETKKAITLNISYWLIV